MEQRIRRAFRAFCIGAVVLMAIAATYRIPIELSRLVFEAQGHGAAKDLRLRYAEVTDWFAGRSLYGVMESADYPPASYMILFPFIHWPTLEITRAVWAIVSLVALAWLSFVTVRAFEPRDNMERAFAALIPLAGYATAATLRLGQMGMLLLPLLAAGTLRLATAKPSLKRDLVASFLLVVALVKPTIAPPFLWIAFFIGGWRSTLLIVGAYATLTLASASFQDASLSTLMRGWLGQRANLDFGNAHGNVYSWLHAVGVDHGLVTVSLAILVALGAWTWRNRHADVWHLMAVAALTARMWTYHHHYDDVLILFAIIALWRRMATEREAGRVDIPGMLLIALLWGFSVAPGQALAAPTPWGDLFKGAKTLTWLATLALLLTRTRGIPSAASGSSSAMRLGVAGSVAAGAATLIARLRSSLSDTLLGVCPTARDSVTERS